jgi:hypothetical protein
MNPRNKISSKLEKEVVAGVSHDQEGASRGRGRGRGGRGGRGRGGGADGEEGREWSLKKYDFESPDMQATLRDHKPNFVKAPRRVFEKHGGYYSDEEAKKDSEEAAAAPEASKPAAPAAGKAAEKAAEEDGFRRVTREEWNRMSKREKKAYLKERKRRKMKQMVYIKDDSDNEQLTSSGTILFDIYMTVKIRK